MEYSTPPFYPGEPGVVYFLDVLSVDKGVVTYNLTLYRRSGSVGPLEGICNISKGEDEVWVFFIAANLTSGDPINSDWGSTLGWRINETIDNYIAGGVPRTVNHLRFSENWDPNNNGTLDMYWDKLTGLMVKAKYFEGSFWFNRTLLATSLWQDTRLVDGALTRLGGSEAAPSVGGGTTMIAIVGVGALLIGGAFGYFLGRRGKK